MKIFLLIVVSMSCYTPTAQEIKFEDLIKVASENLSAVEYFFHNKGLIKLSEAQPDGSTLGNVIYFKHIPISDSTVISFKYLYSDRTGKKRLSITANKDIFKTYIQELNVLDFEIIRSKTLTSTDHSENYYSVTYQNKDTTILTLSPVDEDSKNIEYRLTVVSNSDYNQTYKPDPEE